jgi:hypothetical protein
MGRIIEAIPGAIGVDISYYDTESHYLKCWVPYATLAVAGAGIRAWR